MFEAQSAHPSYTQVLAKLEKKYKNLCLANECHGTKQPDSAFTATTTAGKKTEDVDWSQPTDKDRVCTSPERFLRIIFGKEMYFCWKCIRRGTTEKGRWNTTHHTDGHIPFNKRKTGGRRDGNQVDPSSSFSTPCANAASSEEPTRHVSFKEALSGAAANISN